MNKYVIDWLEQKKTSTGKDVKNATLKDEQGVIIERVSIWGDFPGWNDLRPGHTVMGQIKSNAKGYKSLSPGMTSGFGGGRSTGAVSAAKITSESVKEAQERKNDSIAYFNSLNSAIAIVVQGYTDAQIMNMAGEVKSSLISWRDWFLEEWKKYESSDPKDKRQPF